MRDPIRPLHRSVLHSRRILAPRPSSRCGAADTRPRVAARVRTWACAGILLAAGCATDPAFLGPIPVRNQHPAQLTVMHMDPARTEPLERAEVRARLDAAYSSLFLGGSRSGNSFRMDGEILRAALKTSVGLGDGLDVHLEIPVAHTTGGFLDSFLIDWHELWGLPDQGRTSGPSQRWEVRAERGGATAFEVPETSLALLDVPIALSWALAPVTEERPWGVAVRGGIELPTGDDDRGFGSGELDYSIGLVGELRSDLVALTGHVQHTFAGDPGPARTAGLDWRDVTSAGAALELAVSDGFSFLVQAEYETSVLRDLHFGRASDPQLILWTGARAQLGDRSHLEIVLGEDLSSFVAPDFTVYAGLVLHLGGAARAP